MSKLDQVRALREARYERRNTVTEPVTPDLTPVTPPVTKADMAYLMAVERDKDALILQLRAEVELLKRQVRKAVPAKERMRQMRARKRHEL